MTLFDINDIKSNTNLDSSDNRHLKTTCYQRKIQHVYKRAHSELQLIKAMDNQPPEDGMCYNFITSGDVDALSYLTLMMRHVGKISHLLLSTWCMSKQDIIAIIEHIDNGQIERLDAYVGEIFPSSYSAEWSLLKLMYEERPHLGRLVSFKNHSKIFAGITAEGKGFVITSSANINTNPRTEQSSIMLDTEGYHFYKEFFDSINSIH